MGRHPGWGAPGGGPTSRMQLEEIWSAIQAQNIKFDAVLTGYMGDSSHVDLSQKIINAVKKSNMDAIILVDPVMGDHGSLYIPEERAQKIAKKLIPLADITTPNLWELSYLSDTKLTEIGDIIHHASKLSATTLVTSVTNNDKIGAILTDETFGEMSYDLSHQKFERVPHGGGDSLAALFLAHILNAQSKRKAMERAVTSIFHIMKSANQFDEGELPLIREQSALMDISPMKSRQLIL